MKKAFTVRPMKIEDYEGLYALWMTIRGFGIRSIDDSRAGVERFLCRNPGSSVVAVAEDGDACTMYVSERIIAGMALARPWWFTA